MKALFKHLEKVKAKPHHVRRKIALGAAGGATAVIALAWFALTLHAGTFAIQGSNFAESTGQGGSGVSAGAPPAAVGLAAAGAARQEEEGAHIEIVDAKPAPSHTAPEPTVIPF